MAAHIRAGQSGEAMNRRIDRALATARETLDDTICDCGHYNTEHRQIGPADNDVDKCRASGCRCRLFKPVKFTVTRL